jgi:transposase
MILGTSRAVRVFAYPEPVDLRKGYDGLFGLVKQGLARDPLGGDLYLFVNRRRDGCKVLVWDGTGLCIFQKDWSAVGSHRLGATTGTSCA